MKYVRDSIRKRFASDMVVEKEAIGKYACHVYVDPFDPQYAEILNTKGNDFVATIIGDTWEEVNQKFKEKYEGGD